MITRESRQTLIGIVIVALIAGVLLAGGAASAADEIVLGTAIAQTGKYAREGKFYVDAYTLAVDAVNKAAPVSVAIWRGSTSCFPSSSSANASRPEA
jgi:hypothetical protein